MSKFKVLNKENSSLFFELSLPKEEKVSRTNVLSLLIKSLTSLCFPGEDKYHISYPILSLKEIERLSQNNPFRKIIDELEGYGFNYTDLEMISINTFLLHKFVDNIVMSVSKIRNLPLKEEENLKDLHFKAMYQAVFTSKKWIDFLPENFLLEFDYMHFHDPEEDNQSDNFFNSFEI
jgi:hypothetical protein